MTLRVEADDWGPGASIVDPAQLATLRATLEESPLILEHWHYRGSSSPDRHVFDDFDTLDTYLRERTRWGDNIWIWRFDTLCRNDNALAHGKIPDANGHVPAKGAY